MEITKYFPKHKTRNTKVFVRVFPTININFKDYIKFNNKYTEIYVKSLQTSDFFPTGFWKFEADKVFWNANQSEIYNNVAKDCIQSAINGISSIILGYGQIGSGKSFTMNGLKNNYEQRGIGPRIIKDLLNLKKRMSYEINIELGMSYVEIYKNALYDLLKVDPRPATATDQVQPFDNIYIVRFDEENTALRFLFAAEGRRRNSKECAPYGPSHICSGIITFHVFSTSLLKSYPVEITSKIHVVDMAGIDNSGKSTSMWKSNEEVGQGNLSKSHLEQFLMLLKFYPNNTQKIKLNQNIDLLISYLKDVLTPKCLNLRCIAHIKTNESELKITLSLLRLAQMIIGIKPEKLVPKLQNNQQHQIQNLMDQCENLQKQLYLNAMFFDQNIGLNLCQSRREHVQREVKKFLRNEISELALLNVAEITTALSLLRTIFKELEDEKERDLKEVYEKAYEEVKRLQATPATTVYGSRLNMNYKRGVSKENLNQAKSKLSGIHKRVGDASTSVVSSNYSKSDGKLSKTGVGVGPGKSKVHDSNITKSMKLQPTDKSVKSKQSANMDALLKEKFISCDVPDYNEAWESFLSDESLIDVSILNEKKIQLEALINAAEEDYLLEVQKLYDVKFGYNNSKTELLKLQMKKHITDTDELNDDKLIIKSSECEEQAKEIVIKCETDLKTQSRVVRSKQVDIKAIKDEYKSIQNQLEEMFKQYCVQNYKTIIPELLDDKSISEEHRSLNESNEHREIVASFKNIDHLNDDVGKQVYLNNRKYLSITAKEKKRNDYLRSRRWNTDLFGRCLK